MYDFDVWYKINKNVLIHLYYKLIDISKCYNISIIDDDNSYDNFLEMMYNESSKTIIDKKLYSEFFYKKYNSNGYQDYKFLDINF
jgi:hypothetical protein